MEESYIRGVNQELIRTLKKLIEATENQQQAIIDKLTEVSTAITGKLDTVINNQHEISITADTINLNTDTVEAKLDEVKASIEALGTSVDGGLDTLNTSVGQVNTSVGQVGTKVDAVNTGVNAVGTKVDAVKASVENGDTALGEKIDTLSSDHKVMNPTHLGPVVAGDTTFEQPVVLCNITENNITITVIASDDTVEQSVVLTAGWNPIVVKTVKGVTENTLVYGY